jgi:hypothetical protein
VHQESPEIKTALTDGPKDFPATADFGAVQKAIEAGDYKKAYNVLDKLLTAGPGGVASNEDLPDPQKKLAETMKGQLGFLSQMQNLGVKVCYPPTEAELEG